MSTLMPTTKPNSKLQIIAGPCSVDERNLPQIKQIGALKITNQDGQTQKAISGARVVGLKSRTKLDPENEWIGLDY